MVQYFSLCAGSHRRSVHNDYLLQFQLQNYAFFQAFAAHKGIVYALQPFNFLAEKCPRRKVNGFGFTWPSTTCTNEIIFKSFSAF